MFFGRIIGAVVGLLVLGGLSVFGIIGAAIGFWVGSFFDKGLNSIKGSFNPEQKAAIERVFFSAVFPMMGRLAKSDGHISAEEIQSTELLIQKMGLGAEKREEAITLFKQGASADYDVEPILEEFTQLCGNYTDLKQIFLVYMITIAYADGTLHPEEEKLLRSVADTLGYSKFAFNHLLGMIQAQAKFYHGRQDQSGYRSGGYAHGASSKADLQVAYEALGVESSMSDVDVKKAYRKLMSEYHPDKLAGRGVPEDMVKLATERSQEVQSAYELIKKSRKA